MHTDRNSACLYSEKLPSSWLRQIQKPTTKQWMKLGNYFGRIGERISGPEGDRSPTRKPTESTNMYPQGFQSLNHQTKSIHMMDLGHPAQM